MNLSLLGEYDWSRPRPIVLCISLRVKRLYSKTMTQPILLIAQNHLLFMINYSCDLGNVYL